MTLDPLAGDSLRAASWDEFVGQEKLKERLELHLAAAVKDHRAPGDILLAADPGFGKTSLARIIARRLNVPFEVMTMPVATADLVSLLVIHEFDGVLLLDELHRASKKEQNELMPLVESKYLQYRGNKYSAGWLMIIGATTDPRDIIKPLRDRFDWVPTIDPYSQDDLALIVQQMANKLDVELGDGTAAILGRASGGTPRNARRFALAARDLYVVSGGIPKAEEILDHLRLDENGLTVDHWRYLEALHKLGITAGLKPLCSYLNESEDVVEELEHLLIDLELIEFTSQGRSLRTRGFEFLRNKERGQLTFQPVAEQEQGELNERAS